jgi:hypothetical protein
MAPAFAAMILFSTLPHTLPHTLPPVMFNSAGARHPLQLRARRVRAHRRHQIPDGTRVPPRHVYVPRAAGG